MATLGRLFVDGSAYAHFRPTYPAALFDRVMAWVGEGREAPLRELAVDVGCGTGQATSVLAKNFRKVIAVDPSASQLDASKKELQLDNVEFQLGGVEHLPFVLPGSVDLLTIAQAVSEPLLQDKVH